MVAVDDLSAGSPAAVPSEVTLEKVDIRDLDALRTAFKGVDVVFHQAALKNVTRSIAEPLAVEQVNAVGTLNVLEAARENSVRRVVYASSSSVYGDSAELLKHEELLPRPISPYGVSKLSGEAYCRVWTHVHGLSTVVLRYFNVFGPGQHPDSRYAAVFPAFISALGRGEPPQIYGDGNQSRAFTFVDDVVNANVAAAEAEGVDGEVMNVASPEMRTVNDVYNVLAAVMGSDVPPQYHPPRPGDIRDSRADVTKAKRLLKWEPKVDWEEAVSRTVRWFGDGR